MAQERRRFERSSLFLIAEFRRCRDKSGYSAAVTRDFSPEGFNLESLQHDLMPGEMLEVNFRDPGSDLSVSALGKVIYRRVKWYHCVAGIKLDRMDQEDKSKILSLLSKELVAPPEPVAGDPPVIDFKLDRAIDEALHKPEDTDGKGSIDNVIKRIQDSQRADDESCNKPVEVFGEEIDGFKRTGNNAEADGRISEGNDEGRRTNELQQAVDTAIFYDSSLAVKYHKKRTGIYIAAAAAVLAVSAIIIVSFKSEDNIKEDVQFNTATKAISLQEVNKAPVSLPGDVPSQGILLPKTIKPAKQAAIPEKKKIRATASGKEIKKVSLKKPPPKTPEQQLSEDLDHFQKAPLITYEELFNNNQNRWDVFDTEAAAAQIEDGAYQIGNKTETDALRVLHYHDFSHDKDFVIEASIKKLSGSDNNSYGLIFGAKDAENIFAFQVKEDGHYYVTEYNKGIPSKLTDGLTKNTINKDSTNTLKIVKQEGSLRFCVNDKLVTSVSNISFHGNKVGYIVEGESKIAVYREKSQIKAETDPAHDPGELSDALQ